MMQDTQLLRFASKVHFGTNFFLGIILFAINKFTIAVLFQVQNNPT